MLRFPPVQNGYSRAYTRQQAISYSGNAIAANAKVDKCYVKMCYEEMEYSGAPY